MNADPFEALGLPARPDLTDEQVRAAWHHIATTTHPDRPDGGNLARYTAASAAYAQLRTPWARSEAYADHAERADRQESDTAPLPLIPGAVATALALAVLQLIPGTAAAPADVAGLIWWFLLTGRRDLAPPPER